MKATLSIPTVEAAIKRLQESKAHEQSVFYLSLLKLSTEHEDLSDCPASAYQQIISKWLDVPGGSSPYYRPFASRGESYWMNPNLAGSFAPSSLRDEKKTLFYTSEGKLRLPSVSEISSKLIGGHLIPAWALAAFLFRNCLLASPTEHITDRELIELLSRYFALGDLEFYSSIFDFSTSGEKWLLDRVGDLDEAGTDPAEVLDVVSYDYRRLTAVQLGLERIEGNLGVSLGNSEAILPEATESADLDENIREILQVLEDYLGVILSGAPGTSKSYYARSVAEFITGGDDDRTAFVQFHASYQFEDFMEGYRPDVMTGGFKKMDGIFLHLCKKALSDKAHSYCIVIDELSRGDSQRIFGEALTYIERTKRGLPFLLPSGEEAVIPENVYIIATMNPVDRGADEVDLAFGRRFGIIEMNPHAGLLKGHLVASGMDDAVAGKIVEWFNRCNAACSSRSLPELGHAFFWPVKDYLTLSRVWLYQVRPHLKKVFRFEMNECDKLIKNFEDLLDSLQE